MAGFFYDLAGADPIVKDLIYNNAADVDGDTISYAGQFCKVMDFDDVGEGRHICSVTEGTVTEISTPEGSDWLTYSLREAYQKFSRLVDGSSLVFPLGMLRNPEFEEIECEVWDWEFKYVGKRLSPSLNYPGGRI